MMSMQSQINDAIALIQKGLPITIVIGDRTKSISLELTDKAAGQLSGPLIELLSPKVAVIRQPKISDEEA